MEVTRVKELENCENCRFSFWAEPEKTLLCRRVPPVSSKNSFELGHSLFSQTHRSVWCAEWKKIVGLTWGGERGYGPRAEKIGTFKFAKAGSVTVVDARKRSTARG